jgi:hypothetical protein
MKPGFIPYWKQRISEINLNILSLTQGEYSPRTKDNIASLNAIIDHPIMGLRTPRYTPSYSLREVPPTDIHPLLQIGLVGGIIGILLVIRLFIMLLKLGIKMRQNIQKREVLATYLPLILLSIAINSLGAGGTLTGRGLLAMSILFGLYLYDLKVE